MLSDDRPTDPAWLPIFSKKEHFMGNAFGMIPGLETDEWSNDACRGYVIMAMEDCGFSKKDIRHVVGQLYEVFDLNSVEDACCSDCPYFCPVRGECMYEDECGE